MFAVYKCLRCGKEWEQIAAPTQCPHCDFMYVKWVNYEQLRKMWDVRDSTKNKV